MKIIIFGLLGLPSSLCPTFNRTLREVLSPGCAMDDKIMKKNHSYQKKTIPTRQLTILVSAYQLYFADS
ncbi:MAG: hypothetical protein ACTSRI_21320 [Promethearchaeota archaeon]